MTLLNENFKKELQRMSELAGLPKNSINENKSPIVNQEKIEESKELIKEGEFDADYAEDLLSTVDDTLGTEERILISQGKAQGKLTKKLKTAMVLNNLNQYEAAELALLGEYNPFTPGATPGGTKGTLYTKTPIQKLPGGSNEYNRLTKGGLTDKQIEDLKDSGLSQAEIDAALEADKKLKRSAVTWGKKDNDPQTARWQPKHKDSSAISSHAFDENGKKLFGISKVGKLQLEFLQRMLSERPLPKNGDEDIDIESVLLSDWPYKNLVIANSEHIIRDFFNKGVIRIVADVLKRNKNSPKDSQFVVFVENGINHAIDQTKNKEYNQDQYDNYGAWFIQVVKNKVIDQLRGISTQLIDRRELYDRLVNQNTPLVIDSQLNPDSAINSDGYEVPVAVFEKNTGKFLGIKPFKELTKDKDKFYLNINNKNVEVKYTGTSNKKFKSNGILFPYYVYTFNDPMDAAPLFVAKAEGNKKSPLRPEFLSKGNKTEFYKSIAKEKPQSLTSTTYEPGEGSATEKAQYEGISAAEVTRIAKIEVDNILDEIATEMLDRRAKVGDKVKINRVEALKIAEPEVYKNITKGKEYVITKTIQTNKGTKDVVLDDMGKEVAIPSRSVIPSDKATSSTLYSLGAKYKDFVLEIMREMLYYGKFVPKYSRTVYFPDTNSESGWRKIDRYNWKEKKGGTIKLTKNGMFALPYRTPDANDRYKSSKSIPITYVWDSSSNLESTKNVLNQALAKSKEKGIEFPADFEGPLSKDTLNFLNSIRLGLRKFFGFEGADTPALRKDRDLLNDLLKNFETSHLAESRIRKAVRELMTERFKKKEQLEEISAEAQNWISKKIKFLIDKEGLSQKHAEGKAYGMARQKGFKIPTK